MKILVLFMTMVFLSSCSSFGKWYASLIRGKEDSSKVEARKKRVRKKVDPSALKYSDTESYYKGAKRQYGRMTHDKLQGNSDFSSRTGSLWVPEGQESFLFSENTVRLVGEPVSIKVEGDPKDQLEAKMNVIGDLLRKLEEKKRLHREKLEKERVESERQKRLAELREQGRLPASRVRGVKRRKRRKKVVQQPAPKKEPEKLQFKVKTIPSRITERLPDGSYRVEGSQYFLIGQKEYKVIATGLLRSDDFSDSGVSAEKLLDSRFDIVTSRRKPRNYL